MSRPLPRFTDQAITHDPLEAMLAQREAEIVRARAHIARGGTTELADPADLRGIPCIAMGVGGTRPGTSPHQEAANGHMDNQRLHSVRP